VLVQATINIKVDNSTLTLQNVKEGSNVEVDLKPEAAAPAHPAAQVRPNAVNCCSLLRMAHLALALKSDPELKASVVHVVKMTSTQ
jgi:inosine-uridine nucleoside N-ribohydrolase